MMATESSARITRILDALAVPASGWYRRPTAAAQRKGPGPAPRPLPASVVRAVVSTAVRYPWYGYKKIAVICRRAGHKVKNPHAYRIMKEHGLLQRRSQPPPSQAAPTPLQSGNLTQNQRDLIHLNYVPRHSAPFWRRHRVCCSESHLSYRDRRPGGR